MKFKLSYPEGATPLDPNEIEGLIPLHISLQAELNECEQSNILQATQWSLGRSHPDLLTEHFVRSLHKRMFKYVWRWAGKYRRTEKNIGRTMAHMIPSAVKQLCDDAKVWIEKSTYTADEIGARFHHSLVLIHPFPNGNGRHARLMTDLLMDKQKQPPFTWGRSLSDSRAQYLSALRAADGHNFAPLIQFVRQ